MHEMKKVRQQLKLSQENMAHRLGVAYTTYSRWERGIAKPSPLAREKIAAMKNEARYD